MKKLSILLIAALLIILATKAAKADIEVIIPGCECGTQSPSPTATASPSPTILPTLSPSPTVEPNDVCPNIPGTQSSLPDTYHFDNAGKNCLQWELGGAPPPPPAEQVLGASTSTLAATDSLLIIPRIIFGIITGGVIYLVVKKYSI